MGSHLPIAFSEIKSYADEFLIGDRDTRELLFSHVTTLDRTYLTAMAKKQEQAAKVGKQ